MCRRLRFRQRLCRLHTRQISGFGGERPHRFSRRLTRHGPLHSCCIPWSWECARSFRWNERKCSDNSIHGSETHHPMYLVHKCSVEFFEWASHAKLRFAHIRKDCRHTANSFLLRLCPMPVKAACRCCVRCEQHTQ